VKIGYNNIGVEFLIENRKKIGEKSSLLQA
jgi:hypothetical protein